MELVDQLDHDNLLVRDLSFWQLDQIGVGGHLPEEARKIRHNPTRESAEPPNSGHAMEETAGRRQAASPLEYGDCLRAASDRAGLINLSQGNCLLYLAEELRHLHGFGRP